ncbi:MAG: hypothetical protein K0S78_5229 [Thermomicrobiales bacterium]|jgi:hypothetical protein|nr:hypothetical protein [Thermomicrobiales bacterium]
MEHARSVYCQPYPQRRLRGAPTHLGASPCGPLPRRAACLPPSDCTIRPRRSAAHNRRGGVDRSRVAPGLTAAPVPEAHDRTAAPRPPDRARWHPVGGALRHFMAGDARGGWISTDCGSSRPQWRWWSADPAGKDRHSASTSPRLGTRRTRLSRVASHRSCPFRTAAHTPVVFLDAHQGVELVWVTQRFCSPTCRTRRRSSRCRVGGDPRP